MSSDTTRFNFNCSAALRDAFLVEATQQGCAMGTLLEQLMLEHLAKRMRAVDLVKLERLPDWVKRQLPSMAAEEDAPVAPQEVWPSESQTFNHVIKEPRVEVDHELLPSRLL